MSYIGSTPTQQAYTAAVDYFSGNASTTAFTLSRPVASVTQMIVVIENVSQNPSTAYTVSGNTITFTSAPPSGSNNIWVQYTSPITQVNALSQSPSIVGDVNASGGIYALGAFNSAYTDGMVMDYVTGNGRLTVGSADGFTIYTGGTSARTALASWTQTGALTLPVDASISGLTVGKGGGNAANSTVLGNGAVAATNTGDYVTAVGYAALASNTSGAASTAFGYYALNANTTGRNTAFGTQALKVNTTGSANTAVGDYALGANTTASNNTAVGYQASYSLATNGFTTTVGYQAGYTATDGYISALGYQAAKSATSGYSSLCAIGVFALNKNTSGVDNTAVGGYNTLANNTTGSYNIALGREALQANTTASYNTAVGYQAGYNSTGGSNNFFGMYAGFATTTGTANTFIGSDGNFGAGHLVTTGSKNTILGRYNGNQGGLDIRTSNNYVVLSDGDGNFVFRASQNGTTSIAPQITASTNAYGFDTSEFYPNPDNTMKLGTAGLRWTTVYATTGSINTSDATQKQQIRDLNTTEKAVAIRIKGLIKAFKFNDAVEAKGDGARIHIGVIAQEVQAAFEAEGLDPTKYAMFCSDTWYEVDGKAAEPIAPYTKDTPNAVEVTRLGVRYEQLLAFVISAL